MDTNNLNERLIQKYCDMNMVNLETAGHSNFVYKPEEWECNSNCEGLLEEYDTYGSHSDINELRKYYEKIDSLKKDKQKNKKTSAQIEKIEEKIREITHPDNMYLRLGVDVLSMTVSESLLSICDPDLGGKLLGEIAKLRYKLTDCMGYIIPNVRVMDSGKLQKNEYIIQVRSKIVYKNILDENLSDDEKTNIIIKDFENICFKYPHQIICKVDILKLMELTRSQDPSLVNDLCPTILSAIDLHYIFAELISRKISIKDIILVFEILNYYARYTQNNDELVQILTKKLMFQPEEYAGKWC